MAKAKRTQPKNRREQSFHETLPLAVMPPPAWPELSEHLTSGADILKESGQRLIMWLRTGKRYSWPDLPAVAARISGPG